MHVALASRGGGAEIIVEDTGCGLPAARERMFVPFGQPASDAGNGLGLAIAKRIVERHGGAIDAGDRPGGGARFAIHLPRSAPTLH